jgi:hypothetical protein
MAAKKSVTKKVAPAKKSAAVKKLVPAKKNSKNDAKLGQEIVKRIIDAINSLPEPESKAAKTAKAKVTKTAPKAAAPKAAPAPAASAVSAPTSGSGVQITSSKACQAFAKRANQVKDIVSKARPGASITIDEQKKEGSNPDRGSFVITVGGKKVVELRSMPRPFTAMKALDMEKVANDVIKLL